MSGPGGEFVGGPGGSHVAGAGASSSTEAGRWAPGGPPAHYGRPAAPPRLEYPPWPVHHQWPPQPAGSAPRPAGRPALHSADPVFGVPLRSAAAGHDMVADAGGAGVSRQRRGRSGRRRQRPDSDDSDGDDDDGGRRQRRRRDSSSSSSSEEETGRDVRAEHRRVPTSTRARPAPAALRLPPLRAKAARRLRKRKRFVAVHDAADPTDAAVSTTPAFLARVAAILVHSVFFFPGLGLQALMYLAWLLDRVGGRPLDVARRTDARARQAMALSPRELLTAPDLDHFLPAPASGPLPAAARAGPVNGRQICWRYLRGECRNPCPAGRLHGPGVAPGGAVPQGFPRAPPPGNLRRQPRP